VEWHKAYFDALRNLGWAMSSQDFREHTEKGNNVLVHKAIMSVMAAVLGPAAVVIKCVFDGLEQVGSDNGLYSARITSGGASRVLADFPGYDPRTCFERCGLCSLTSCGYPDQRSGRGATSPPRTCSYGSSSPATWNVRFGQSDPTTPPASPWRC
jgi:hypothetical protein